MRTAKTEMDIRDGVELGLLQISSVFSAKRMADLLPQERNIKAVDAEPRKTFRSSERAALFHDFGRAIKREMGDRVEPSETKYNSDYKRGTRSAVLPLSCRYRTDRMYHQKKLRGPKFYTDTLFGRCKSLSNNTCAQIFTNEHQFVKAYPMESKTMAGQALRRQFIRDFGEPEKLTSDGASEQVGVNTDFKKNVRKHGIDHHLSEPGQPLQNWAESVIRDVKRRWFRLMVNRKFQSDSGITVLYGGEKLCL